jgi:hypothetical protein
MKDFFGNIFLICSCLNIYKFYNSDMKKTVTQEVDYGCGVACFAFVTNMSFQQAIIFLGIKYSVKHGWKPSDLVKALNRYGHNYKNNYVRNKNLETYRYGTIVLLERSIKYPVGHYLVLSRDGWMDPWINMHEDSNINQAISGYREEIPGKILYALIPS